MTPRDQAIEEARQALDAVRLFSRINDFGDERSRVEICRYGVGDEPEIVVIRSEALDCDERALLAETISTYRARAAIDAYESARARLDGAKMMPREADTNMLIAGLDALVTEIKRQNGPRPHVEDGQVLTDDEAAQRYMALGSEVRSSLEVAEVYRAMHDATPKEGT